jgi:hypothetical protein
MKVLVCGGRDFTDRDLLFATLDRVLEKFGDKLVIVHGACPTGADAMAEEWAKARETEYMGFPARWSSLGKPGGYERNKRMRDKARPDAAIAFKGGDGTAMMCRLLEEIGVEPWRVGWSA